MPHRGVTRGRHDRRVGPFVLANYPTIPAGQIAIPDSGKAVDAEELRRVSLRASSDQASVQVFAQSSSVTLA